MERLEVKKINGRPYYYYSQWQWVNGKCRRVWQKYLGRLEDLAQAADDTPRAPLYAEIFQWGLPLALWQECQRAEIIACTDQLCPKREQGLSTGEYLVLAAINRAMIPSSKRGMWEWFSATALRRQLPTAHENALASQRFWDHMERIDSQAASTLWQNLLRGVVRREAVDLSRICYDGTNFYTFIDTFNVHGTLARRGKNKQGRNNLRQVSYALFCCGDSQLPLYYEIYEGNRNDAKQFPLLLEKFGAFLNTLGLPATQKPRVTLVFDKGNNSAQNFQLIDSLELDYVGSLKPDEHKTLTQVANGDGRFVACPAPGLEETKAFRVKKLVYGKERTVVVAFNQTLFNLQWMTLQNDLQVALTKLAELQQSLQQRHNRPPHGGTQPTAESVEKKCAEILSRQHLKQILQLAVEVQKSGAVHLNFGVDTHCLQEISETYLGKNLLVTSHAEWSNEEIIKAYRSQSCIEEVFKQIKDRQWGSWWPLFHWTDSKIKVHGLYCTIALLLRALMLRRVKQAGLNPSMKRLLTELQGIRQVINLYAPTRRHKQQFQQAVLSKTSELQQEIMRALGLHKPQGEI